MSYERVKIWDLPVRLTHWAIVMLVAFSWWSGEEGGNAMTYHMWSGYTILTLVLFRILWGFVGSAPARFMSFVRGPRAVCAYLATLPRRAMSGHPGHNPVGGWSVVLLLLSLGTQAGTGLFANDDIMTEGPLAHFVSKGLSDVLTSVHHFNFWVLLTLTAIHIAAVLFYYFYKSENLIAAMLTGNKHVARLSATDPRMAGMGRAAVALAAAAALVYLLVNQ